MIFVKYEKSKECIYCRYSSEALVTSYAKLVVKNQREIDIIIIIINFGMTEIRLCGSVLKCHFHSAAEFDGYENILPRANFARNQDYSWLSSDSTQK